MTTGNIGLLRDQVDDVKQQQRANINKVIERGDKLENLEEKAEHLKHDADLFQRTAHKVHMKQRWKGVKLWCILITIIAVILLIIFAIIVVLAVVIPRYT